MRTHWRKLVWLLLVAGAAAQQSTIERQGEGWTQVLNGSLTGAHNLRIRLQVGAVHVEGSSTGAINYVIRNKSYEGSEERARRQFDSYRLSSYVRGDTAWIVGEWQGGRPHRFSSDVTVTVPRDIEAVKIETEGGSIVTTGIAGRLDAESGGGAIHLDDIGGQVSAETGGGAIDVGNVGADLVVRTGGGSIHIGSAKGKVTAESGGGNLVLMSGAQGASLETGGGSIHVDKCTGRVRAETGGGSIELGQIGGEATLETGGGSLKLTSASGAVRAETGGGSIELYAVPAARAETGAGMIVAKFIPSGENRDSELETGSGDITVYLVPSLHLTLRASIEAASGHQILTDFPEIRVSSEGGRWEPKLVSAEGDLNGGGFVLKLRTTMGNIYIRRAQ
jgi:hypothetical protein